MPQGVDLWIESTYANFLLKSYDFRWRVWIKKPIWMPGRKMLEIGLFEFISTWLSCNFVGPILKLPRWEGRWLKRPESLKSSPGFVQPLAPGPPDFSKGIPAVWKSNALSIYRLNPDGFVLNQTVLSYLRQFCLI